MKLPVLACGLALLTSPAWAQGIDLSSGGPVDVTARGGFEFHEQDQTVVAEGDARAVRGNVTVLADRLLARYRKKPGSTPAAAPTTAPDPAKPAAAGEPDAGANEVYRLEADGHVRILTPTDEAVADHAIYDIDQAVLVLTGHGLKITTPSQVLTARDSMEYWSQRHLAIGRGDAVVVTNDGRRIQADTLVAYTKAPEATPGTTTVAATPAAVKAAANPADPLAASGKVEKVEAFGNVDIRTATDQVRGDRGVYVPDTGIARVVGHVRITHGQNQLNGPAADVNMKTGVAHIISGPSERVSGLLMPNTAQPAAAAGAPATGATAGDTKPAGGTK